MAIDISNRKNNHINKITISNKPQKGMSFLMLSAVALFMSAVGFTTYIVNANTIINMLLSAVGFGAVPIISFLTAEVYNTSQFPRKAVPFLALTAIISHVTYILLDTGGFDFFSRTSIVFAMLMGYMGLVLQNMQGIDNNVKTVVILLICIACMISDGGSITAVWIIIFAGRYDNSTKMKLFYTAGIILIVINLIYGIIGNCWYGGIYQLGFLLSVPLIKKYNVRKSNPSKDGGIIILYPMLILTFWLIGLIIN